MLVFLLNHNISDFFADRCGVCEGHNETCQEYTGNFYVSDLFKTKSELYYYYVTTIPKGNKLCHMIFYFSKV